MPTARGLEDEVYDVEDENDDEEEEDDDETDRGEEDVLRSRSTSTSSSSVNNNKNRFRNTAATAPPNARYQYKKASAPHRTTSRSADAAKTVTPSPPPSTPTPTPTAPTPILRRAAKYGSSKNNRTDNDDVDNYSVASMKSTKSTKSVMTIRTIFRRKQSRDSGAAAYSNNNEDDDVTVNTTKSSKSRGWWNRSKHSPVKNAKPEEKPTVNRNTKMKQQHQQQQSALPRINSFRFKKKTSRSGRSITNDQLVADFFDVQSLASEPDFVGNNRLLKKAALTGEASTDRRLETKSVISGRNARPSIFAALFLRNRAINDEVAGIVDDEDNALNDPPNNFQGAGINFGEGIDSVDDDEDVTLGSAFENISLMDSLQDDESVYSIEASKMSESGGGGDGGAQPSKDETLFLHRILQKRSIKKEDTNLHKVLGGSPLTTESESPLRRGDKSLLKQLSTKSLGALPTSTATDLIHCNSSASDDLEDKPRGSDGGALCRWESDRSLGLQQPMAPKRPSRRSVDEVIVSPLPMEQNLKSLMHQPKSSQSMRNLQSTGEGRNRILNNEDDDDSILSLLSGLLASWSDERNGVINNAGGISSSVSRHVQHPIDTSVHPRGILKTSRIFRDGEHKEDHREQNSVVFDKIEIREYERVVGDNPSCSRGPPISIGWAYMVAIQYHFDDYEKRIRRPKRSKKEFHLGADKRTHLLVTEWECCEEDIRKARREATYIQYCRAKTSFSGSRAAAKEAAFLRKASDRTKQGGKKPSMKQARISPDSQMTGSSQNNIYDSESSVSTSSDFSWQSNSSDGDHSGSSPKPILRRSGYLEIPQQPSSSSSSSSSGHRKAQPSDLSSSSNMQSSSSRHRPLVGA